MGQITLEIPDGFYTLDPQKRAEVEAQIQHLLQQAVESTSEPAGQDGCSLMDLAGCLAGKSPRKQPVSLAEMDDAIARGAVESGQ